ncbi:heparinase II/III domain-containing protein [Methylocaldum sp. MU1018]
MAIESSAYGRETVESLSDDEIKKAFAGLKAGRGAFAPAREAREDWARARRLIDTDSRWKSWAKQQIQMLETWMGTPRDKADRVAGWVHDYVDAKTGRLLKWSPSDPEPGADGGHERFRAAWIAYSRIYNIDRVLDAARLFRLTESGRYRDWAASQLDFYADAYAGFPLQTWNGRSRLMTQSLDEAKRGLILLEAVRLLRDGVSAERLAHWRDRLFLPMAGNLRQSSSGDHNIALWHAVAMTLIGLEFGSPELADFGKRDEMGISKLLSRAVSPDYFWHEMSLSYQDYVVEALCQLFTGVSLRGKLGDFKRELWIAQNLMLSPVLIRFSGGDAPTLNDSPPGRKTPNRERWRASRRVFPTSVGLIEAQGKLGWDNLLDPPEPAPDRPDLPPVVSHQVPGLYGVLMHKGDWQAFLRYGQGARYHAQQESLTYELRYKDTWLLRDAGTVGYGSPLHREYFRRAVAHNVPLVGGDGQEPWPSAGQVDLFDPDGAGVAVSHPEYRRKVTASRKLAVDRDEFVDEIRMTRKDRSPKALGFVLNTDCVVSAPGAAASPDLRLPDTQPFRHWKNWAAYRLPERWTATLDCRGRRFAVSVQGEREQRVFIGTVPDSMAPYTRHGLYVETTGTGAVFRVGFKPLDSGPAR